MPHIHTDPGQHDLTTTAFIIRTGDGESKGLLHLHRKLDMLLPVGGHVELNETPWAAVIHEVAEESGYEMSQLSVLQPRQRITQMDGVKNHPVPLFLQTHAFKKDEDHSHVDIGFLFVTEQLPATAPEEGESAELIWLTNAQIQERKAEMPADIAQIYDFAFHAALPDWDQVSPSRFDQ
ncbi:MAG: NUDIX domain-containing protein [Patescibacteria group bacterium]